MCCCKPNKCHGDVIKEIVDKSIENDVKKYTKIFGDKFEDYLLRKCGKKVDTIAIGLKEKSV